MAEDNRIDQGGAIQGDEEVLRRRVLELSVQLEQVTRDLEALNYSISHDLRAPLRSIEGFCEALLEDYEAVLDATGQDYLRRVGASSRRMSDMIDGLLQLSRLGRSDMRYERVNLTRIARAIATRLRSMDEEREVTFVIQEGMSVDGDLDLLLVVVENMLSNAWRFTSRRQQARIEFGTMMDGEVPVYMVRDDGVGFDMAYADKLFAPFQRLHTAAGFEGKGIGLALVRRAVHRHGGRVWAEAAVDQGATFYFTLQSAGGA